MSKNVEIEIKNDKCFLRNLDRQAVQYFYLFCKKRGLPTFRTQFRINEAAAVIAANEKIAAVVPNKAVADGLRIINSGIQTVIAARPGQTKE